MDYEDVCKFLDKMKKKKHYPIVEKIEDEEEYEDEDEEVDEEVDEEDVVATNKEYTLEIVDHLSVCKDEDGFVELCRWFQTLQKHNDDIWDEDNLTISITKKAYLASNNDFKSIFKKTIDKTKYNPKEEFWEGYDAGLDDAMNKKPFDRTARGLGDDYYSGYIKGYNEIL